ncbi:30S ribosomal protein S2 [Mesomycoplasma ovipneumoniae]|uniref:Small ribosomal subunit protein uS2 n=2 Tax=Mesomycoplasma ovipneumoniae TaxID=29562 RepID=A0AAJ2P592_9BACT|nr:30S ribosomal protein S2 [Mesomycoplasma ovipneumoniae]MDW2835397.1 30S ribosomal protein S2 [Mesomycoplasma ovipneumoniae]MDW2852671.1 30S ribosomal protein S2 [Mesomycoplasma ovipneumoniae]MDW2861640.1 30S ribosomal protein S2 [Mesomycoplasma ovipneumoniae]MDW2891553.1 30S ribosomal protein S2 [Mesomycoplasma ovipneumoniae]MDW2892698.1 30S ribosomal protein S2 [Mesomycoplasma ovipneumoniae]
MDKATTAKQNQNIEQKDNQMLNISEISTENSAEIPIVSKQKLLEAGVYFGHKSSQWHPKMAQFLLKRKRNETHIIDVLKTQKMLEIAYKLVEKFAQKGAKFIFVGTKKQAKKAIEEQAIRTNSIYVSGRWLGGTLTNSRTILSRLKAMEELEKQTAENFEGYTKKEILSKQKQLAKLQKNLNGIKGLKDVPLFSLIMLVADPLKDIIAVKEARKKGIKIIGITDSNVDPSLVDFGIPANDDSTKSITLIFTILADAISSAKGGKKLFAYQPDEQIILPEDPEKEQKQLRFRRNSFDKFEKFDKSKSKPGDKKVQNPSQSSETKIA